MATVYHAKRPVRLGPQTFRVENHPFLLAVSSGNQKSAMSSNARIRSPKAAVQTRKLTVMKMEKLVLHVLFGHVKQLGRSYFPQCRFWDVRPPNHMYEYLMLKRHLISVQAD
jgi:hypothetical protein